MVRIELPINNVINCTIQMSHISKFSFNSKRSSRGWREGRKVSETRPEIRGEVPLTLSPMLPLKQVGQIECWTYHIQGTRVRHRHMMRAHWSPRRPTLFYPTLHQTCSSQQSRSYIASGLPWHAHSLHESPCVGITTT
jgi:hypothetical protein